MDADVAARTGEVGWEMGSRDRGRRWEEPRAEGGEAVGTAFGERDLAGRTWGSGFEGFLQGVERREC